MNLEENNGVPGSPEHVDASPADAVAPAQTEPGAPEQASVSAPEQSGSEAGDDAGSEVGAQAGGQADSPAEASAAEASGDDGQVPEPWAEAAPEPLPTHRDDEDLGQEHQHLKRHHVAPAMIAIDRIDDDPTFRIRAEGDISQLATDIARLGQLFPIDIRLKPPDRFQIICGFRRVAALKFLQRDRVLARLHTDLTDEDALLMALVSAIHARPVEPSDLERIRLRFENDGRLTPSIRSMIEKALSPEDDLGPELVGEEEEVEAEALAEDVTFRLGAINQDLSLLADVFDSLDQAKQEQLLEQLRYSSELVAFLEARR